MHHAFDKKNIIATIRDAEFTRTLPVPGELNGSVVLFQMADPRTQAMIRRDPTILQRLRVSEDGQYLEGFVPPPTHTISDPKEK